MSATTCSTSPTQQRSRAARDWADAQRTAKLTRGECFISPIESQLLKVNAVKTLSNDWRATGRTGRGAGGSGGCHYDRRGERHSARDRSVGYNARGSERTVLLTQDVATRRWCGSVVDKDQCLRLGGGIDCPCVPDATPLIMHGAQPWCFSGRLSNRAGLLVQVVFYQAMPCKRFGSVSCSLVSKQQESVTCLRN